MVNERQFYSISREDAADGREYISRAFDSGAEGTVWHRAKVFGLTGKLALSFFASDDEGADIEWGRSFDNAQDVALFEYKGRYLRARISRIDANAEFDRIRLYYPAHTFARYLPEVYQTQDVNSFFIRFLAVFQAVYLDMDERITDFPSTLEPRTDDASRLSVLAEWLGFREFSLIPRDKRGELLLICARLYKSFGTRSCLEYALERLCGEKPVIVEYEQTEPFKSQERIIDHYGSDELRFTVIIRNKEYASAAAAVINGMKPAYTYCKLVALENNITLDEYAYLGVNSYI